MEIRWAQILFQVLNFGIIFFVLNRFVYKPVLKMLDERAGKIKDGLQAAEKNLQIQDELEEKQKLAEVTSRNDAQKIVADAKKEAKELLRKAEEQAKVEAKKVLAKEREAFEASVSKSKEDFKKEASEIVAQATEAVLRGNLTLKLQQDLIDKQINELTAKQLQ